MLEAVKVGRPSKIQALHDQFALRLNQAADNDPNCPPKFQGQLTHVVAEMGKRGKGVTVESVRKWFNGETMPSNDKVVLLADVFHVDFAWLTGGEQDTDTGAQRKLHNALATAAANILAGVINMDGGYPAFPSEADDRARRDGVDLYAIIRGVNYSFQVIAGEAIDGNLVFQLHATRGMVLVIAVVRRENNRFDFYELDADTLVTGKKQSRGMIEISVTDGDPSLRKIESFAQRL